MVCDERGRLTARPPTLWVFENRMPFVSDTVSVEGGGMIDPMTSLAFSVYSGKGVYALLLGSGVSRTSGIMTGWDIVQDLIRKVAAVEGKDCGENPAGWYEKTYGKEPDYSD